MRPEGQEDLIDRPSFFAQTLSLPSTPFSGAGLAARLCLNCCGSGDGRKRLFDTLELICRDHAPQYLLESWFCRARKNVLPAVGSQGFRVQPGDILLEERRSAHFQEVVDVGCRLGAHDTVHRRYQLNHVVYRAVAFTAREGRVLSDPFELVDPGVLRL